jgi:2-hydroxychromene-2-carboxylate isomerase
MTPRPTPQSLAAERIAAHRDPRSIIRVRGREWRRAPELELYYEPGDPHSHLCAQLLGALRARLGATVVIRLVGASAEEDYPEADRQRAYALIDAARIAPARGLTFPAGARRPSAAACRWAAAELAAAAGLDAFLARERDVAPALFSGEAPERPDAGGPELDARLAESARRRHRLGHNLPGVWQYDGDWFWGVDRLDYLEARLRHHDAVAGDAPLGRLAPERAELPELGATPSPLNFFFSFRSPYSYLAAVAMSGLHREWPTGVVVRPVLPMAMRNLSVPRVKRLYTVRDVKREADRLGVPFGRIADPIGAGARRCLQAFPVAEGTEQQLAFLASAAQAIFAEGVDVATDAGLSHAVTRAGMSWPAVRARIAGDGEIEYAAENREALLAAGLWGVPCFTTGDFAAWGQDRLWMVRELLRRSSSPPPR